MAFDWKRKEHGVLMEQEKRRWAVTVATQLLLLVADGLQGAAVHYAQLQ